MRGEPEPKDFLRFVICGGVDDGKSTLAARLLSNSGMRAPRHSEVSSAKPEQGGASHSAYPVFLLDLQTGVVTRSQGPGRGAQDIAINASAATLAIILVDAQKGVLLQTRRDTLLLSLLGVRHIVLAINKMDLLDFSAPAFEAIRASYRAVASQVGVVDFRCIPLSALHGDNVFEQSDRMPWYEGRSLVAHLEDVSAARGITAQGTDKEHSLAAAGTRPAVASQFEATVIWAGDEPLLPGRSYLLQAGAQTVTATVATLKHRIDINTMEKVAARRLDLNDIGVCGLELTRPIVFEPYATNRDLGSFVLFDLITNAPVGSGLFHFALRRSENVQPQTLDVDRQMRAELKGQRPCVLWFTGLSGAGKSTIANLVEKRLLALGRHTYLLDGDNVRRGLNKDLGFTDTDRVENIRRVAEVARLMADGGLIVLVAFISPFRAERRMARGLLPDGEFVEVFVDTPLAVAETRDPKGLYKKARRGDLENFTGVDSPYEAPEQAELRIDTIRMSPEDAAEHICGYLSDRGMLGSRG
jgi:bifunctional enzyme CysN/CysC